MTSAIVESAVCVIEALDAPSRRVGCHARLGALGNAVARGERAAPPDARKASFNRRLLSLIRDRKPQSVAELVALTGRAQPNLTRTLAKLEAAGFIRMKSIGRRERVTSWVVLRVTIEAVTLYLLSAGSCPKTAAYGAAACRATESAGACRS